MKIVDLTMPLDEKTPVFPGDPKPNFDPLRTIEKEGCNVLTLSFASHIGTHIDAPFHFIKEGKKIHEFALDYFIGNTIVFDCTGQTEITLTPQELSKIEPHDIVFIKTKWSDVYTREDYFLSYPILTKETAENLVRKKIRIIGVDTPSPDKEPYNLHSIFLKNNICIVENLINLSQLPKQCISSIIPLNIINGDGAPCRVFAMV